MLTITAQGAQTKPYVKSLAINGQIFTSPIIRHDQIAEGGEIVFEMSDKIESWGNTLLSVKAQGIPSHVEL
jgi:putative alpha-1,2-mannosidase